MERVKMGVLLAMRTTESLLTAFKLWHSQTVSRSRQKRMTATQKLFDLVTSSKRRDLSSLLLPSKKQRAVNQRIFK